MDAEQMYDDMRKYAFTIKGYYSWLKKLSGLSASSMNSEMYRVLKGLYPNMSDKDFNYVKGYIVVDVREFKENNR
jgi:hypothetical protein